MLLKEERLEGVHPDLVKVVRKAAEEMPFDVMVLEGLRSEERQKKLVAQGASKTMASKHLTGKAVDIAPMIDKEVSWSWPHYNELAPYMKAAAQELEVDVQWGGDWRTFKDGPHWELH